MTRADDSGSRQEAMKMMETEFRLVLDRKEQTSIRTAVISDIRQSIVQSHQMVSFLPPLSLSLSEGASTRNDDFSIPFLISWFLLLLAIPSSQPI